MEDLKIVISNNISELRKAHGYTQFELAERLNYSDKSVSKWERGDSVPDVAVLKEIADLFGVSLDYMVESEHKIKNEPKQKIKDKIHNHGFITGICILLVWLVATVVYVMIDITTKNVTGHWLAFVYAIPVSMIVWLVFNSIWFNRRRNFAIVSLLMWSILISLFVTFFQFNIWKIFVSGIPGQIIILLWSRIKLKNQNKE